MNTTLRYKFAVVTVCASIAVALGFALYEGYIPLKVAQTSIKQAAGRKSSDERVSSEGGPLQQRLSGTETPQEYIHIETAREVPRFATRKFTVHAGRIISVTLTNNSKVGHSENWVLVKPGSRKLVEEAAQRMPLPGNGVPKSANVLAFVPMTRPGQSEVRLFRAPDQPGDYPYLSTNAGRGEVMNGILHVIG